MTKIPVNALYTRRIEGGIKFEVEVATVAFSALFWLHARIEYC